MKIISFVNQKGGSSKTTTASLFARSLCNDGKKVLIIDTDPQGGISSIYKSRSEIPNVKKETPNKGIFDILLGEPPEKGVNVFQSELDSNIDIVLSDYRLDKTFLTLSPYSISNSFKSFSKNYDYVLIDTPPTLQGVTRSAIFFSNEIFVPSEISRQSYQPTIYTLESIKESKKRGKVIFIGWKDPEDKNGFQNNLARTFQETFKKDLIGLLPRNITAVSFSSEKKNPSESVKENIIKPILEFIK